MIKGKRGSSHNPPAVLDGSRTEDPSLESAINLGSAWRQMRRAGPGMFAVSVSGLPDPRPSAGDITTMDRVAAAGGAMRMSQLAAELGVNRSTATRAVDRLVKSGLAVRDPDPDDARGLTVSWTEAGSLTQSAASDGRLAFAGRVLERFANDDQEVIGRIMPVLAAAIAHEFGVHRRSDPPRDTAQRFEEALRFALRARPNMLADAQEAGVNSLKLEPGDVDTMDQLAESGECRMSTIAKGLMIDPSTATLAIDRLVARGLVKRRPDPDDKRATLISFTPAGNATLVEANERRLALALKLLAWFDQEDQKEISRLWPRLANAIAVEVQSHGEVKGS